MGCNLMCSKRNKSNWEWQSHSTMAPDMVLKVRQEHWLGSQHRHTSMNVWAPYNYFAAGLQSHAVPT